MRFNQNSFLKHNFFTQKASLKGIENQTLADVQSNLEEFKSRRSLKNPDENPALSQMFQRANCNVLHNYSQFSLTKQRQ